MVVTRGQLLRAAQRRRLSDLPEGPLGKVLKHLGAGDVRSLARSGAAGRGTADVLRDAWDARSASARAHVLMKEYMREALAAAARGGPLPPRKTVWVPLGDGRPAPYVIQTSMHDRMLVFELDRHTRTGRALRDLAWAEIPVAAGNLRHPAWGEQPLPTLANVDAGRRLSRVDAYAIRIWHRALEQAVGRPVTLRRDDGGYSSNE